MPLSVFHKNDQMANGHLNQCPDCKWRYDNVGYEYQRPDDYWKKYHKKYRRENIEGIWRLRYEDMKKRVNGAKQNHKGAEGKRLCSKEVFLEWCENNRDEFESIWQQWKESGYERKLSPSIDRIDNDKGYFPDNMQWITVSENASKHED